MIETLPAAPPAAKPAEPEKTTPLKLSEAIRLGCLISKPVINDHSFVREGQWYACALGAAYLALGGNENTHDTRSSVQMKMRELTRVPVRMPCEHRNRPMFLDSAIIHLNDMDLWSREDIADWVAKIGH